MASYVRQSTFVDGDLITASLFNNEYNKLVDAFDNATGHKHDGTVGEGPVIGLIGDAGVVTPLNKILVDTTNDYIEFWIDVSGTSTQQFYVADGAIVPTTNNDIDLGTSSLQFKDLYINGTANIDSLVADTADINGGTIDGVTIGGSSAGAITGTTITGTSFVIGNASINETELEILDGATLTTTELNYVDGVTSSIQTQLNTKAPLSSPSLTGIPTAPTASANTNTTQVATTAYVQTEITDLIGAAPGTLDTLNELAAAINDDANYNTTLTTALATKLPLAGGTMTGNVTYSDNVKAQFGTSQDLQIYHDVSNSIIKDAGAGNLELHATNLVFKNSAGDSQYASFFNGGAVTLRYAGSPKVSTTSTGIDVTGVITTDGLTTSADINFGDNNKAIFGAGNDLDISHSGTNSFIQHLGTGDLYIRNLSDDKSILLQSDNGSGGLATYININGYSGTVTLSHYGSQKLITNSTGINVTGTVTSDGLDVTGTATMDGLTVDGDAKINDTDATPLVIQRNGGTDANTSIHYEQNTYNTYVGTGNSGTFVVGNNADLGSSRKFAIEQNNDISFYDDTGSQGLFWDASAESLGIGETNIDAKLHLTTASAGLINQKFESATSAAWRLGIPASQTYFAFDNANDNLSSPKVVIDSSGNLLVGTTSSVISNSPSITGINLKPNSATAIVRSGGTTLYLNRLTDDGEILALRKNGTTVGSIGVQGGRLIIGSDDTHIFFDSGDTPSIRPHSGTAATDAIISLGESDAKFKDLHLSGTANFGSLSDGTITITGFADEDNMVSNSATLVPTQQSVKAYVDSQVSSAGGNGISFEDDEKAQFGDGNDLQIYHDGSHSYIYDGGVGDLKLQATNLLLEATDGTNYIHCADDGAVRLYYNGLTKLATTSSGIDVTGTVTSDGLTVDGVGVFDAGTFASTDILTLRNSTNTNGEYIGLNFNNDVRSRTCYIRANHDSTTSQSLSFGTDSSGTATQRLKIDGNGDISFYDDTGSTQGLFWDASAERLGIGTTLPSEQLHVTGASTTKIQISSTSSTGISGVHFGDPDDVNSGRVQYEHSTDHMGIYTNNAERMRIDSSGNVGIGTTSPSTKLHVLGNAKIGEGVGSNSAKLMVNTVAGQAASIQLFQDSTESWVIQNPASTTALTFSNSNTERLRIDSSGLVGIGKTPSYFRLDVQASATGGNVLRGMHGTAEFQLYQANNSHTFLGTANSADLVFITGTTERARIDSSGNVGIGTTAPSEKLTISDSSQYAMNTLNPTSTAGNKSGIAFHGLNSQSLTQFYAGISANFDNTAGGAQSGSLIFETISSNSIAERLRITSSGELLLNKTSASVGTDGVQLRPSSYSGFSATSTTALFVNRNTNDGDVVEIGKNGVKVGSIGTRATYLTMGTGDVGLLFNSGSNRIQPENMTTGAVTDNLVDLGYSGGRFKDLYLSGTGYFGSTTRLYENEGGDAFFKNTDSGADLFIQSARRVRFLASNSEAMRIDSTGNVGIGTTSPERPLHIASSTPYIVFDETDTSQKFSMGSGGGKFFLYDETDSAQRLTVDTSGNVGIGVTSPTQKLYVKESGASTIVGIFESVSSGSYLSLEDSTTTTNSVRVGAIGNNFVARAGGSERMRIDSSGNVGIGTSSPACHLNVSGSGNGSLNEHIRITSTDTQAKLSFINTAGNGSIFQDSTSLCFATDANTERMRLDSSGRLGIGTSSPSTKLHVNAGGSDMVAKFESTDAGSYINIVDSGSGSYGAMIGVISDDIILAPNNVEAVRIDAAGNVGIGTSSPSAKLEVNGYGKFTSSDNSPRLYLTGGRDYFLTATSSGLFGLYDNTASSYRLAVDTSGKVGIGTSSPARKLEVNAGSASMVAQFKSTLTSSFVCFANSSSTADQVRIGSNGTALTLSTNYAERMRIDSSGNLLVGTTDTSLWNNGAGGNTGTVIESDGTIQLAKSNNATAYFNRLDSDGDIVSFRKDGSSVGSIGTQGGNLFIENGNVGLLLNDTTDELRPAGSGGVPNDNVVSLGASAKRFKDLHLSGTGYFGTNIAINAGNKILLSGAGDNTHYIYHDSSTDYDVVNYSTGFQLEHYSSGTQFTLDGATGNVGIGTNSPAGNLQVYTSANRFQSLTGAAADLEIVSDNNTNPVALIKGTGGADLLNVFDNTTEVFTILDGGNVGIGTDSPISKFQVNSSTFPQVRINETTGGGESGIRFRSTNGVNVDLHADIFIDGTGSEAGRMGFRVPYNSSEKMTILSSGNVGIGTNSPATPLHISNTYPVIRLTDSDGTAPYAQIINSSGLLQLRADDNNSTANSAIQFFVDGGGEKARIDSSGNVGIGTSSPQELLHLSATTPVFRLEGGSRSYQQYVSGTNFIIRDVTATANRITLDASGNVGIGTAAPETPLHVSTAKSSVTDSVLTLQDTTETFGKMIEFVGQGATDCRGVIGFQEPQDNAPELYIANGGTEGAGNGVGLAFWSYTLVDRIIPCDNIGGGRDNAIDLGSSSARFDDIYATNGTIQTSDRNDKQDIEEITDAETRVAVACKGLIRKFRWKSAVAEKDDNSDSDETARIHFGIIAQDLQDAFTAEGLDAGDYAMFTSQTWEDSDGVEQTRLGVRYSELLAFIIAAI